MGTVQVHGRQLGGRASSLPFGRLYGRWM